MKAALAFITGALVLLLGPRTARALDPSLQASQYGHTAWTAREGFSVGAIFAMAQTPDGYLWLGTEFGLFRFDGIHAVPWHPPSGQLPQRPYALLVTRDGTLWIGTFGGLASWDGRKLTQYPEIGQRFVTSLLEDHEGTVWAGILYQTPGTPNGQVCAIRIGTVRCYSNGGAFGSYVWSLAEDRSGTLWAGAESGFWRWNPTSPKRYPISARVGDMATSDDGQVIFGISGGELRRLVADRFETFPIRNAINANALLADREVDSNKLLRDRDGGLWIGTHQHGLIHVHNGRTDVFTKSDGLSGDISCSLFEDREGNVWYGSTRGLDRFRELAVTSISTNQGLSSDAVESLVAGKDGTMWVATRDGLTRLRNGQTTIFRKENGLPDNFVQSLYNDSRGRLWASYPAHGLSFFENGKFVGVSGLPSEEVSSITGDEKDNLWLCGTKGLSHLRSGRLVETVPWSVMGRHQRAKVIAADRGGIWLAFWIERSLLFFKDGRVQESYTSADGLGKDEVEVVDLRVDQDGALWVATHYSGIIRIKDGHIATLTTKNGVPSDTILWSIEDNDRSVWLYTASGLVRISRSELHAWIADPNRTIQMSVWNAADGVALRETASPYSPSVAKSSDGKLWFHTGEGVQLVDPRHLAFNKLPPPVHIDGIVADHKVLWQNLPGTAVSNLRLSPRTRDLALDYTALSLVAPEKVVFKYKLEGQDTDWREVVNDRQVQYSNLRPGHYRFRVIAANNSGVWNETGDTLDFTIPPAWYQTWWFRAACVAAFLLLLSAIYQRRVQELQAQEKKFREAVETMPALAFVSDPSGNRPFVNRGWLDYTGMSAEQASGSGWQKAIHPDDLKRVVEKWRTAQATGDPLAYETRMRRGSDGAYRWFQTRARPLFDRQGKVVKWCAVATDIEDRKRAEQLQADLAHVNRVSTLGELAASISHELNQPIAAAIMHADVATRLLERYPPDVTQARQRTTKIVEMGTLASEIIDRLRSLYKKEPPKRVALAVNEVIGEMVELLRGQAMRHGASLRTDLTDDLPTVVADRVQLQQVLMNLMLNGIEAMGETGGVLTVKSEIRPNGQVEISVNDNGPGLPPGKADQIFDTFFTTKPQGSGMGLAISKSIVESHDGQIWADGETGHGATFHFTLPPAPIEAEIPVGVR